MATLSSGATSGAGGTLRWSLTGPAWWADVRRWEADYQTALRASLQTLGKAWKADAQRAYVGTRFADTFGYRTQLAPYADVRLFQPAPLFAVVEYPTRPHPIVPRTATVLHWMSGGQSVFARSVQHPGTKGRGAMAPLIALYAPRFRAALTQAVIEAVTAE